MALFPVTPMSAKSLDAREAFNPDGLAQRAVRALKDAVPELGVMTDVALDPFTTHGQDGLIDDAGYVMNDETVEVLVKQAVSHAEAGADIVAPSDMMDGRIGAVRAALEQAGHHQHPHHGLLGQVCVQLLRPVPRRRGLGGQPRRRRQVHLPDGPGQLRRGPARGGLDLGRGRRHGHGQARHAVSGHRPPRQGSLRRPTFVYHVSGEYAMLKAASQNGWLDERAVVLEALTGCKRAGATAS
jgi:porphobilinogen synthase